MHTSKDQARYAALIAIGALALFAVGCGEGLQNGGGRAFRSALGSHVEDVMGTTVELVMYTCCEGLDSSNPETRCAGVSSADIQVFFDGRSLLFDFSNVRASGVIADAGFEGYVLSTSDDSRMSEIVDASVDPNVSSVSADEVVVEVDEDHVAVDLRGLAYDDRTFVKVDISFLDA
jgi:hypothetical protein